MRDLDATRPDIRLALLASRQLGVVDVADLRRCGLDKDAVARRVRAGHLHPLYKRVFAVGHTNLPPQARILAAVKACGPDAYASRFASGELSKRIVLLGGRRPDVLVLGATTRRHPEIRVHRTTRLDPQDVTRIQGIPATTVARTLVDLAADLTYEVLRRAIREAEAQRLVALPQLVATMNRLRPFRGATNLARIVATGPALLEAAGERVLRVRWEQAVCRESQTLRRIRAAGAPSG
jgi:hypothetical protein